MAGALISCLLASTGLGMKQHNIEAIQLEERMTRMTPDQCRAHLARLEISQQAFARLVCISPQHFRKMLRQHDPLEIPRAVELLLLTPAKVRRLVAELEAGQA